MLPSVELGFAALDRIRRRKGAWLGRLGYEPVQTAWSLLAELPALRIRQYGGKGTDGPVLLIVPAPIKRPYIWDIEPDVSVVRHCLDEGLRVFMLDWKQAGPATADFGLAQYGDALISEAVDKIREETGEDRLFLAGHSLGGTLAAIFASLHPDRVSGLILLESPLSFGGNTGALSKVVRSAKRRKARQKPEQKPEPYPDPVPVPGSVLSLSSLTASPRTFGWERIADRIATAGDKEARATHMRVERWTLDEFPMPRPLFQQVTDWLYGEDRFMAGTLDLGGRIASPGMLTMPLFGVADQRSTVVPYASVEACFAAAPSPDKRIVPYEGDVGVALQHVGVLVGRNAHRLLWPEILDWIGSISRATAAPAATP